MSTATLPVRRKQQDGLSKLSQATELLAEVKNTSDAKKVMDMASAAEHYARKAQLGQDAIDSAHVIKIDAQRMLGEFLQDKPKANGGQHGGKKKLDGSRSKPSNAIATLSEIGIPKCVSANSQALAQIAEKKPEVFSKVRNGEMTLPQARREVQRDEKRQELVRKAEVVKALPETQEPAWKIITGDCIAELKKLKRETFRLVFADPPYNIGVDYGDGAEADQMRDDDFVNWCQEWIRECSRVLTDDGSMWVLINDEYADHFGLCLRAAGLHRRSWIKWYESFGVNVARGFNRCSRHLFYCVKDPKRFVFNEDAVNRPSDRQVKYGDKRADAGGKNWDDIWGINPPIPRVVGTAAERIPDFPTQLPLRLLEPIVGCASEPGDQILDPFNGSGTTGVAAIRAGRRYIGIEKNPKFAELAALRLRAEGK